MEKLFCMGFFWVVLFCQDQTHANRSISYAKLPLGVNECECLCAWYTAMDWSSIQGVLMPHNKCSGDSPILNNANIGNDHSKILLWPNELIIFN